MKSNRKQKKPVTAEAIAHRADQGQDVSQYFMNTGRMMGPIQRVNVDFASPMLEELDNAAQELNISRQAVRSNCALKRVCENSLFEGYRLYRLRKNALYEVHGFSRAAKGSNG
jgi:hypothetical protein